MNQIKIKDIDICSNCLVVIKNEEENEKDRKGDRKMINF